MAQHPKSSKPGCTSNFPQQCPQSTQDRAAHWPYTAPIVDKCHFWHWGLSPCKAAANHLTAASAEKVFPYELRRS